MKCELTICQLNINGLITYLELLENFIDGLKVKPEVILCYKTWAIDYYKYVYLNDFHIFYNDGKIKSLMVLIRILEKNNRCPAKLKL